MSLETLSVDTKFYRSLLTMVRILRDGLDGDVEKVLGRVADQLADDLQLPLVWIGILEPGSTWVNVTAKAGSAWEYAQDLRISSLEHIPEGRGPGGKLLRLGEGVVVGDFLQSPEFAPWRELVYSFTLKQNITSVKSTEDGSKVIMGAFLSGDNEFPPAIPPLLSDLTQDLAIYVQQKTIARDFLRLQAYQRAVLNVQQQLLHQNNPQAMYDNLVRSVIADTEAIGAYIIGRTSEFSTLSILAMDDLENNALSNQGGALRYSSQGICPTIVANEVIDSGLQYGPVDPGLSVLNGFVNDNRGLFVRVRSVMAIPVFLDGMESPFVALVIEADELRYFTKPLQETLRQLAASLGVGLSRYFEHIKLEAAKSEIEKLALHDALTNLPNRRFLEERLEQAVYRSHIYDKLLAICMLDLDGFKSINDTHGHDAGDLVLCTLAQRFQLGLRKNDFVARLGGDEFVILIEELSDVAAFEKLVRKIGEIICSPISIDHTSQVSVGVSLGAVIYPFVEYKNSVTELLRHADYALYESKSIKEKRASFWMLYG